MSCEGEPCASHPRVTTARAAAEAADHAAQFNLYCTNFAHVLTEPAAEPILLATTSFALRRADPMLPGKIPLVTIPPSPTLAANIEPGSAALPSLV